MFEQRFPHIIRSFLLSMEKAAGEEARFALTLNIPLLENNLPLRNRNLNPSITNLPDSVLEFAEAYTT